MRAWTRTCRHADRGRECWEDITYLVRHGSQLVVVDLHPRDIGRILHLRRPRHQPKITHIQVKVHTRHPQRFQKRQDRVRPWAQRVSFFNVCTRLRLARTGARLGPLALRTHFPALQVAADCKIAKCSRCACVARKSHQRVCQVFTQERTIASASADPSAKRTGLI